MRPLREDKAITLNSAEAAFVRQALVAAAGILALAQEAGGPAWRLLAEAALEVPADGRPIDQVSYDVHLAVDYIDFAEPARRDR